jgi:hypothetical protein
MGQNVACPSVGSSTRLLLVCTVGGDLLGVHSRVKVFAPANLHVVVLVIVARPLLMGSAQL